MRKLLSVLVATSPASLLIATLAIALPAHATGSLTRTFVSSTGIDTNPCTIAAPCATFAAAYAAVAANGIIAALDPGKYGPLTSITTGVTINGNGWSAITAPASGNGITVNADTANVTLIGLEIDGAGAAYNGIVVNSAGSLTVTDCTLQNFQWRGDTTTGIGILMQPTSGTLDFGITNTNASNNGYAGIRYAPPSGSPSANAVINHVVANANEFGIYIDTRSATGGTTTATVSNSIASANISTGISAVNSGPSAIKLSIDNVSVSSNQTGIFAGGTTNVLLGGSVISGNIVFGVNNQTSPNTFYTYNTNRINLNDGTDILNAMSTSFSQQ